MSSDNIYLENNSPTVIKNFWHYFSDDKLALIGFYGVSLLLFLCLFGYWLTPYALNQQFLGYQLLPPSWVSIGEVSFFLGTDDLGRDILSRLLAGTAPSFGSSLLTTAITFLIGLIVGSLSGLQRGLFNNVLGPVLDVLLAMPSLLIAIIITVFLGTGLPNAMLAVGLAILPYIVRTIRTSIGEEQQKTYVIAARLDGASYWALFWQTVLPNITPKLITEFTRALSIAIIDISALGFLGLGARSPTPEWGLMLGDALDLIYVAPWSIMVPGIAITFSILMVNLLGDGIRRAIVAQAQ